jgi:PKD repeat protein
LGGSGDIADINLETSNISNLSYGANTLRWTITNKGCESADEMVINNNSVTPSDAGLDRQLCADTTILYGNPPAYGTGEWLVIKGSAIFADQNAHNSGVSNLGQGENLLRWQISNAQCSSTDDVYITNNTPTQAIAGSDQDVCGSDALLHANTPNVGSGTWTLISGGGDLDNVNASSATVSGLNPGPNKFRWTITNFGCTTFDDVIIYNNIPFEANAGTDMIVCGTETNLYANEPGDAQGKWSVLSRSARFVDSSSFESVVTDLGFGKNTLKWTITFADCSTSDIVEVTNNKAEVNAGIDQTIDMSVTTLAASNPAAGSGEWSVVGGDGTFDDALNSITKVRQVGPGINTFKWTVNVQGCLSSDEVIVTYQVPPVSSFVADIYEGCPPLEVYFVNNSLSELPFTWDFGNGDTSNRVSVKHTFYEPGDHKVQLTVYGDKGETITKDTVITVYNKPVASFEMVSKDVYIPEQEAIFINTSQYSETYRWEFGDGNVSVEKDPYHTYEEEGQYQVTLIAISDKNCSDTLVADTAVNVITSGGVKFPNAFTPSLAGPSDGSYSEGAYDNGVFHPYGEGIDQYHLEIFNKWGILIFESHDKNIGWDGYFKGHLVEKGVYVWKVSGVYNNGKDFKKVGTVVVIR